MSLQQIIEQKVTETFSPIALKLENESHRHAGNNAESHFKMVLISDGFQTMSKVKRHQAVYKCLADEMPQFHALALHTYTSEEWRQREKAPDSPNCTGGH